VYPRRQWGRAGNGTGANLNRAPRWNLVITQRGGGFWTTGGSSRGDIGIKNRKNRESGKSRESRTRWTALIRNWWWAGRRRKVIAGEHLIVDRRAGSGQPHSFHFAAAGSCTRRFSNGITTMIGGGTGPATWNGRYHLHPRSMESGTHAGRRGKKPWPMNFGFLGKGKRRRDGRPLAEQD